MTTAMILSQHLIESLLVDNLKIQKLLFYCQAVSVVKHDKPIFKDKIEAWQYGPVIKEIYFKYNIFGNSDITVEKLKEKKLAIENKCEIDVIDLEVVGDTLGYYGEMSGTRLINETHSEDPWKNAYKKGIGTEITIKDISDYYKKIYTFN